MRILKRLSLLTLTGALVFAFGCSSSPTKEGSGEFVDDAAVTTKVKAEILREPSLKAAEINVETFKGVVQLSGFVATPAEVGTAADVARKVPGVKEVRNDVKLRAKTTTTNEGAGQFVDDTAITAKVKTEILQAPTLKSSEINVETFKGVVQLSGFVASQAEIATAAETARKVKGVSEVRNDVQIKNASNSTKEGTGEFVDNAAITAKVKAALLKDASLKSAEISVETFKGVVQLTGFVGYQSEADTAAKLAGQVKGVKSVTNDIRIKGKQ